MSMRHIVQQRRGIAVIWTALFLIVLVGFIGLATDTAWVLLTNHQLKNSADAAALAGVRYIRQDQSLARTKAVDYGLLNSGGESTQLQLRRNDANAADGDVVIGRYNRVSGTFTTTLNGLLPNALKVSARRNSGSLGGSLPLIFGHIFGTDYANPEQTSIGYLAGGLGAGLLVLDPRGNGPGNGALTLQGTPDLQVLNGTIQVNSASNTAVSLGGNWALTGEEMNIVGAMSNPPASLPVNFHMPPLPDPLAWLQAPNTSGMPVYGDVFNPGTITLNPGVYSKGIRATSAQNHITCTPGVYVIGVQGGSGQRGLDISGGTFTANNCTFYIAAGAVNLTANASVTINPPPLDQGYYYEHISIFQARNNYSDASIWAGNTSNIEGTLYFPGQPDASPPDGPNFDLNGGGFGQGVQVICFRARLGGNANLNIFFDGWWPGPLTSRVFLVQ